MIPSVQSILSSPEVGKHINEVIEKLASYIGRVNMPISQPTGIVSPEWLANNIGQIRMANFVLKLQLTLISGLVDYIIQQPFHPDGDLDEWKNAAISHAKTMVSSIGQEYEEAIKQAEEKSKLIVPGGSKIIH